MLLRSDGQAVAVGCNDDGQCSLPTAIQGAFVTDSRALCPRTKLVVLLLASATDSELISITCTSLGGEERATVAVDGTLSVACVLQRLANALRVLPWFFEAVLPDGRRLRDCPVDLPFGRLVA